MGAPDRRGQSAASEGRIDLETLAPVRDGEKGFA